MSLRKDRKQVSLPTFANGSGDDVEPDMRVISQLLACITNIRNNRQQVSMDRLLTRMRSKGIATEVVEQQLELAVRRKLILKLLGVNGVWSFADPNNVNIGRFRTLEIDEDTDIVRVVYRAVRDIKSKNGCDIAAIESFMRKAYDVRVKDGLDFVTVLDDAVKKGIDQGFLAYFGDNGSNLYCLGPKGLSCLTSGSRPSTPASKKKNEYPSNRCFRCNLANRWCLDGLSEGLLTCSVCRKKAHPSCADVNFEAAERVLDEDDRLSWECSDCKSCVGCQQPLQSCSLRCGGCDKGFHKAKSCSAVLCKVQNGYLCPDCKRRRDKSAEKSEAGAKSQKRKLPSQPATPKVECQTSAEVSMPQLKVEYEDGIVTKEDEALFRECQRKVALNLSSSKLDANQAYPRSLVIGKWLIDSWYSAPYPQEYARLSRLYVCEFCLKYMKSNEVLTRHMKKCRLFHPPGDEIYRKDSLSFFEVDGSKAKIYCQNLCLLAKVFLDHKTLYYDVEPFLFYVLTVNDEYGCHIVGYFSKEKYSAQKFNVSCIVILPPYQKMGYGRLQIAFSYLLSRKEGDAGTPEKPLSELGRFSYQSFWKSAILEFFDAWRGKDYCNIKVISEHTGMTPVDIVETMQSLDMITLSDNRVKFVVDWKKVDEHMKRIGEDPKRIALDEQRLRWLPHVTSLRNRSIEALINSTRGVEEQVKVKDDDESAPCTPSPALENSVDSTLTPLVMEAGSASASQEKVVRQNGSASVSHKRPPRSRNARRQDLSSDSTDSASTPIRTRLKSRETCRDPSGPAASHSDTDSTDNEVTPKVRQSSGGGRRQTELRSSQSSKNVKCGVDGTKSSCRIMSERKCCGSLSDEKCSASVHAASSSVMGGHRLGIAEDTTSMPSSSRGVSPDKLSSENSDAVEAPPRLKTATEESEVDTDTEIQQLTIGSVEKLAEDEPPKLLPMTNDGPVFLSASPGGDMPKLSRVVDTFHNSSDRSSDSDQAIASVAVVKKARTRRTRDKRKKSSGSCSLKSGAAGRPATTSVPPPDLEELTPIEHTNKGDSPSPEKEYQGGGEQQTSTSAPMMDTVQQPIISSYDDSSHAHGSVEMSQPTSTASLNLHQQPVASGKVDDDKAQQGSSEMVSLVRRVRRESESNPPSSVVQDSPNTPNMSPYAGNMPPQIAFTGSSSGTTVVHSPEFQPATPMPVVSQPLQSTVSVHDAGSVMDVGQRFSGYTVATALPKQTDLHIGQQSTVTRDGCFARGLQTTPGMAYENFSKLCPYTTDPIGQPYTLGSSTFTGLPPAAAVRAAAVHMNNSHSAAPFANNTVRAYQQSFSSTTGQSMSSGQYPSQAACYYYTQKNSNCLSQPTAAAADILPTLNSNFYMNAAYMPPAAMFGSPTAAGYFQSNSAAAAAAFMASNHHHHHAQPSAMPVGVLGFPQNNFQDASSTPIASPVRTGAPSNPLYYNYNYLAPAMMSSIRR